MVLQNVFSPAGGIGIVIIGTLVSVLYKAMISKIDRCQTKEMCNAVESAIKTEISIRFEANEKVIASQFQRIHDKIDKLGAR